MAGCAHRFARERPACPHAAVGETGLCLWHNRRVRKDDDYVPELVAAADDASHGDLEEAHLAGVVWPRAKLGGRQLRGADLRDAALGRGDLQLADLRDAVLRRADLRGADLRGANLAGADLAGANLGDADLRGANLACARLEGATVNGADLRGADFGGAHLAHLRWNRLTRFSGAKGLEAAAPSEGETRAFFAPLAMGDAEQAHVESSALTDPDPDVGRTQVWEPSAPAPSAPLRAPIATWRVAAIAATLAVAAFATGRALHPTDADAAARLAAAESAAAAATAEEKSTGADNAALRERLSGLKQVSDDDAAALAALRAELRETRAEAERLRGVEDRVARLRLALDAGRDDSVRLAKASARQEEVGSILADGVQRLTKERDELSAALADARARADAGDRAATEATKLRGEMAERTRERDALASERERLSGELIAAQADLERYLARAKGSGLEGLLVDDSADGALVPVVANEPIALSGDYLITVRIAPGSEANTVTTRLCVQRPDALANPDVAVVLYDREKRPLRRLGFGFPHVDAGGPFAAASATVACERFPSYARVVVAPGAPRVADSR